MLVILAAVAVLLALAYAISGKLLRPPRHRGEWTPRDLGYEYEEAVVETREGFKLRGWFIPRGTDRTVVVIHGYTSSRWGDYVEKSVEMLARRGFNVALFDMRAHGESEGRFTTLGYLEAEDVRRIIDWLGGARVRG
jgi:Predicted hydrolase of the alpha/beta-hydrolase fold